jgi:hypothetical protein
MHFYSSHSLLLTHKSKTSKNLRLVLLEFFRVDQNRNRKPSLGNTSSDLFWAQAEKPSSQKTSVLTLGLPG